MAPKSTTVVLVGFLFIAAMGTSAAFAEDTTLLLSLGLGASDEEKWDGWVKVDGGNVSSLQSRHFLDRDPVTGSPRAARLTGPAAWEVSTRRDELLRYMSINYLEMSPAYGTKPLFLPVSVWVILSAETDAKIEVNTAQGDFSFNLSEVRRKPLLFLDDRARVQLAPTVERLSDGEYEDDEASLTFLDDGTLAVAWVAYAQGGDHVRVRFRSHGVWSAAEVITPEPGDLFRCSLAVDGDGHLWAFWSQREGERWHLWGRQRRGGRWGRPQGLTKDGSSVFHRTASGHGHLFLVWQRLDASAAGPVTSDVYLKEYADGSWSEAFRVSDAAGNDWEPAVAAGPKGRAFVAWDTYQKGNYDVLFRTYEDGSLGAIQAVTSSPRFQAQASVAVDGHGQPWVAWNESGVNWGKDQGFLINPPLAVPLHQERTVRVAYWDGSRWSEPRAQIPNFYRYRLFSNLEKPQIVFDGRGALHLVFRHWTRQFSRGIGTPIIWESFLTRLEGDSWSWPVPLPHSAATIEKVAALGVDRSGDVWGAWMSDDRTLANTVPRNAEIYSAKLAPAETAPAYNRAQFIPLADPAAEAVPIHPREAQDVRRVRDYVVEAGDKRYKIYRGDLHRHSDVSPDFKYDGSLIEIYRYAIDSAAMDFIAPTDHQAGHDQEFTWWQSQKLADLFHVAGAFTPLFAYERSLRYPNGHRNIFFEKRGVRTFPIPVDERRGEAGAEKLFSHLRRTGGLSIPHSSGTDQGTDWRDNDPEIEPVIEIYQGYRASYEYPGAPKAASNQKLLAQRSGYQPLGYWWKALERGRRLGVVASSDHWSTHISYACIVAESLSRKDLFAAIQKRHTYGATDNIILDFRAEVDGQTYIMGDLIRSQRVPRLHVIAVGTGRISQVVIVKNEKLIYTSEPGSEEVRFDFLDTEFQPNKPCYYYVRVFQENSQIAWSSPIWVNQP